MRCWILARTSIGLGDNLLLSAVARELVTSNLSDNNLVLTAFPELFLGNPHVHRTIRVRGDRATAFLAHRLPRLAKFLPVNYHYIAYEPVPFREHPIRIICRRVHPRMADPQIKVDFFLKASEGRWAREILGTGPTLALQAGGVAYYTRNKAWFPQRFQELARRLQGKYQMIQLGAADDPPILGAMDFRGKTSLRQAAALLSACRAAILQEGFLSHLANAVGTPAVIILGGFNHPAISYPDQLPLATEMACAPCFLTTPCPLGRECLRRITVSQVLAALEELEGTLLNQEQPRRIFRG
jgi:hypothetical protein